MVNSYTIIDNGLRVTLISDHSLITFRLPNKVERQRSQKGQGI